MKEVLNAWERAYIYACKIAAEYPNSVAAQRNMETIRKGWEDAKAEYLKKQPR